MYVRFNLLMVIDIYIDYQQQLIVTMDGGDANFFVRERNT